MRSLSRSQEGVSPVIAVILLVAITVVLASVVYIMVSNMVIVNPQGVGQLSATYQHTGANWTISITTAAPGLAMQDVLFQTRGLSGTFVISPVLLKDYPGFTDEVPVGQLSPSDSLTIPYATHPSGSTFTFMNGQTVLFEGTLNA